MLRPGMIKVSELIEGELAISTGLAQHVSTVAAIFSKSFKVLEPAMSRVSGVDLMQSASSGELLQRAMKQAVHQPFLESLVEVADLVQLVSYPTGVHLVLEFLELSF